MFKGLSCFPMSPCKEMKEAEDQSVNIVDQHDMLITILNDIDKLHRVDTSFLTDKATRKYFKQMNQSVDGNGVLTRFSHTSQELKELL